MEPTHYLLAGGGTGGHLFPGIAVARALRRLQPEASITFFTTSRPLDRELLGAQRWAQHPQPVRPFPSRPWHWPGFLRAWRASVRAARQFIREHRVTAVLGLGGYAAAPPVLAAAQLGVRRAILNPDAVPGRANRWLARRAELVVLQWETSVGCLPPGVRTAVLGCPIREEFASADAVAGRRHFGLDPARPVLLVTGASQGARSINQVMHLVWPAFVRDRPDWQLLHLSGPADEASTRSAYQAAGAAGLVLAFTHDMPLALAAADVVVSRAGASTLAELCAVGRAAVLLPYPYHRDRHQHANAQVLVEAGAALMLEDRIDPRRNAPALRAALELLAEPAARQHMAAAARTLARPRAAHDVATWLAGEAGGAPG